MKKRILTILAVLMLVVGLAGQALAYFAEGDIIRVVYDLGGTKEVMTDLGSGFNYTTANSTNSNLTANNFSLSNLGISDWSNVYVAYFTITTDTTGLWLSGPTTGTQNISSNGKWNAASSATTTLLGLNKLTGVAQNINNQTDDRAYVALINSANPGTFKNEVGTSNIEANLASFNAAGQQYVDQYLYYYANPNGKNSVVVQVATIRTYEDGHTEINPSASAVPVPAAIYLLGSGLLALVGIRRKTQTGA